MNNRRIQQFLFATLALAGCAATAITVQANEPPKAQQESVQPGSDSWITTKVKADLLTTRDVSGLDIKVETVNGVVALSGVVETRAEAERAIAVARGIEGVKRVDDSRLVVRAKD